MVLGAVVGIVSSQVLGALWYSPRVLGNTWMRVTYPGKTEEEVRTANNCSKAMPVAMASYALLGFLINFALGPLLKAGSCVDAFARGVLISMVVILIDVAHCMFSARPLLGFVIDHAYDLFVITLMCICIATIG